MNMITIDYFDGVLVARLKHGITNALGPEMITELAEVIERIKSDSAARALVLTSANEKFFSIGFDIPQLYTSSQTEFKGFYRDFNRICLELYTLPKPTVAALTGHAIAGGCILALCCDYRLIGQGRKLMGLNEIKLGVPVPYLADCCLRALIGARQAREVMESGDFYGTEATARMGMVDEVLPVEKLVDAAVKKAGQLGALPATAYGMIKQNRVEGIEAEVKAKWEEKERLFIECWYSDEARERLQEAMKSF